MPCRGACGSSVFQRDPRRNVSSRTGHARPPASSPRNTSFRTPFYGPRLAFLGTQRPPSIICWPLVFSIPYSQPDTFLLKITHRVCDGLQPHTGRARPASRGQGARGRAVQAYKQGKCSANIRKDRNVSRGFFASARLRRFPRQP